MLIRIVAWVRRPFAWFQLRVKIATLLSRNGLTQFDLSEYLCALREEAGFSTAWLEAMFIGIVLLIVLVQFMLQQGLPQLIAASNNTTALVTAGADAATVSWVGFIGKVVVIFMLIGILVIGIRVAMGGGNNGGGGGHRRRAR